MQLTTRNRLDYYLLLDYTPYYIIQTLYCIPRLPSVDVAAGCPRQVVALAHDQRQAMLFSRTFSKESPEVEVVKGSQYARPYAHQQITDIRWTTERPRREYSERICIFLPCCMCAQRL